MRFVDDCAFEILFGMKTVMARSCQPLSFLETHLTTVLDVRASMRGLAHKLAHFLLVASSSLTAVLQYSGT